MGFNKLEKILTINEMKKQYYKKVPKMFVDYGDSGSWSETTYHANMQDFHNYKFMQKVLVDISDRNLKSTILDKKYSLPLGLAPIGALGMQRANGEILAAKAAEKFDVPFILSTMSVCSIEEVVQNTSRPFWFQLYMMKDRRFMKSLIMRAKSAQCCALVLTVDLQIIAQRHNDIRNGLSIPPKLTWGNAVNILSKYTWWRGMLATKNKSFGNIQNYRGDLSSLSSLSSWVSQQFDLKLCWEDIAWVKEIWQGPIVLKGIMSLEDARRAVSYGVDALIVSNHGGRQLDCAPSSIGMLEAIVEEVGKDLEVYLDGGVRSGQDILKAYALGAKAVFIGRSFVYGLGAFGQQGVEKVLAILHKELDYTMALCGYRDITTVNKSILC